MNLFQRYLVSEFTEEYEEGRLTRREALKMIASISGSLIMANSILAACTPPPAEPTRSQITATGVSAPPTSTVTSGKAAQPEPTATTNEAAQPAPVPHGTVSPDDPVLAASPVEFPGEDARLQGYLAHPAEDGAYPVILVCHENRGLTDHIRDVTRRLAKAGYTALAVDLLSRQGGSDGLNASDVPGLLGNMPADQFVQDFISGRQYLEELPYALTERTGMLGFCFGGGVTWQVAAHMPALKAAAPFYGPHPLLEDVPGIHAAILAVYGEQDQRINQGIPAIEAAMAENGKIYQKIIYPNAGHAFFNDTGSRYNAEAAQDAWNRVIAWFEQYV
jgi:carboxymethylenebutenolidase